MARRRKSPPPPPPSTHYSIGNCEITVESKAFTTESKEQSLEISLSRTAKVKISVAEELKENDCTRANRSEARGDYYFVLANPRESDDETKSLLQEVLNIYMKELPAMNYAANTGKESAFLERCLMNGKYCTLLLKSKEDGQAGEVIAAITYQLIPADTQCAEVPLAAVNSIFQRKGVGRLLYLELRKRLQSVGVCTLYCWGDKESEGFWLKQGFIVIGEVDKKGKARRLRVKADIRRSLCFPGGSTLMVSHLLKDNSVKFLDILKLPELTFHNQDVGCMPSGDEALKEVSLSTRSEQSKSEKSMARNSSLSGCQDVRFLPATKQCSVVNASGVMEGGGETDGLDCSCSGLGTKRRIWEASCTSLKSKKVKGTHSTESHLGSHCPVWTSDGRIVNCDKNLSNTGNNNSSEAPLKLFGKSRNETNRECQADNLNDEDYGEQPAKCPRIMLMNIADDYKKSNLTKIIEDLGGVVTSDGSTSTHVVTGKVRQTLNFCTALCSGSWIISPGWLKESFKTNRFADEMPFILNDEEYKTKYRTELKSAVFKAKTSPSALLKDLDIWLATHIKPPAKTLSAIVVSAGGNVISTRSELKDVSKTLFIACEEDMEGALTAVKLGVRTFSVDWFMNCIMRQELDLDAPQFAESL